MPFWAGEGREQDVLEEALGTEEVQGYHLEIYYQTSPFWEVPRRGDGTRFPCIDDQNVYSGCLGSECMAKRCWAGKLVPSAPNSTAQRIALPRLERKGCKCHRCVSAVDTEDGKVTCAEGHFERPISPACLIRRRVPESAPIPCPDFQQRQELRSDVATHRKLRKKREEQKQMEEAAIERDDGECQAG